MSKTATSKKRTEVIVQKPRPATTKAERPMIVDEVLVRWQATEYEQRMAWWWLAILLYFTVALTWLMLAMGLWSNALLIVVIFLAVAVYFGRKPKTWTFTLRSKTLTAGNKVFRLEKYRAYTVVGTLASKRRPSRKLIVLLPKERFRVEVDLYLTSEETMNGVIADAFASLLKYDEAGSFQARERVMNRFAQLMRLS